MNRFAIVLVLVCATLPAGAAPPLETSAGPDRTTTAAEVLTAAALDQDQVTLAYGPNQYLAVWREGVLPGWTAIRAARLQADGTLIDNPPLTLAGPSIANWQTPAVVYDGSDYLVAWYEQNSFSFQGRYVSPLGALGANALQVSVADPRPVLAAGGGKTLIVHRQTAGNGDPLIVGRLADAGGALGAEIELGRVAKGNGTLNAPSVAYGPDGFLVAWEHLVGFTDVFGTLVTTAGQARALGRLSTTSNLLQQRSAVAYGGGQYLAVWSDSRTSPMKVFGAAIPSPVPDGGVPDGGEFQIAAQANPSMRPQVSFHDGHFLVVWEDVDSGSLTSTLYAVRVAPPQTLADASPIALTSTPVATAALSDTTRTTVLASAGSSGLIAWRTQLETPTVGASGFDVVAAPLGAGAPSALSPTIVSRGPHRERSIAVASSGDSFLAVWEDGRDLETGRGTELYAQRYDRSGAPMGAPYALVAEIGDQRYPAVAALPGGDYLVAWLDGRQDPPNQAVANPSTYGYATSDPAAQHRLFVGRVDPSDGLLRVAGGVPVLDPMRPRPTNDRFPSVTADPKNRRWLVAWDTGNANLGQTQTNTVVVKEDGSIGATRALGTGSSCGASAAWSGASYLVAVEQPCFSYINETQRIGVTDTNVVGFRLDMDGAELETLPIAAGASLHELAPSVAAAGSDPANPSAVMVTWEAHDGSGGFTPTGSLRGALVGTQGVGMDQDLITPPAAAATLLRWPRLASTGTGFLLSYVHEASPSPPVLRAVRVGLEGRVNAADLPSEAPLGAALSTTAVASALPLRPIALSPERFPDPVGGAQAAGAGGQVLLAYVGEPVFPRARSHSRVVGGRSSGDPCDRSLAGVGCGDGLCERDATGSSGDAGLCCTEACSGPCQRCTIDGCVGVPPSDPSCGTVSCAALDTACRTYADAPAACIGYGQCSASNDLSTCSATNSTPVNEGGACPSPGCSREGACQAGACICPDQANRVGERRLLDGCSVGGRQAPITPWAMAALALMLAFGRGLGQRQRSRQGRATRLPRVVLLSVLLGLATSACSDPGVMEVDLTLSDELGRQTSIVRVVIDDPTGQGFPATSESGGGRSDQRIRNVDVDGDGVIEIVADLQPDFPLLRGTTYLKVVPSGPQRSVTIRAVALDLQGNPFATSTIEAARLPGDRVTLALDCVASGCAAQTREELTVDDQPVDPRGHAVSAIAGTPGELKLIAVGVATDDEPEDPGSSAVRSNRGKVQLRVPNESGQLQRLVDLLGARQGDHLGAAVAFGRVSGEGAIDLVLSAPNAADGAGRIYVLPIPADLGLPDRLSIEDPALGAQVIEGAPGEFLGWSLALLDVDGDGLQEIVAGAPGGEQGDGRGAVYLLPASAQTSADGKKVSGQTEGAHLGRSVSAGMGWIAAGAPGANAVYVLASEDFDAAGPPTRIWTSAAGGGLGTTVLVADLDSNGTAEVISGAPAGAGVAQVIDLPSTPRALGDADVRAALRSTVPGDQLGATLVRVRTGAGDGIVVAGRPGDPSAGGTAYYLTGTAIEAAAPTLPLDPTSTVPAAIAQFSTARLTAAAADDVIGSPAPELILGDERGGIHLVSLKVMP